MKKSILICLSLLLSLSALATADVRFWLKDSFGNTLTNRKVLIGPLDAPLSAGGRMIARDALMFRTDASGIFYISNMVAQTYACQIQSPPTLTTFYITVTNSATLLHAEDLRVDLVPSTATTYTKQQIDDLIGALYFLTGGLTNNDTRDVVFEASLASASLTTGPIISSGANFTGPITADGLITSLFDGFVGYGGGLTSLDASQLTFGTVPNAAFPAVLPALDGSLLTDLPIPTIQDVLTLGGNDAGGATLDGLGTVSADRIDANSFFQGGFRVATTNGHVAGASALTNATSSQNTIYYDDDLVTWKVGNFAQGNFTASTIVAANNFIGKGQLLTNLNANSIDSGSLTNTRLYPTVVTNNGTLGATVLIGNGARGIVNGAATSGQIVKGDGSGAVAGTDYAAAGAGAANPLTNWTGTFVLVGTNVIHNVYTIATNSTITGFLGATAGFMNSGTFTITNSVATNVTIALPASCKSPIGTNTLVVVTNSQLMISFGIANATNFTSVTFY